MAATAQRYTTVAIVLHWAIAFSILFLFPLGLWMHEQAEHGDLSTQVFRAYQLHKSIGLTVLALSLVRLAWRLINPPPPLPAHMPGWERFIARVTHWAFYALMFAIPLSGWLYVSAGWSVHDNAPLPVATHWFGLVQVPALFGLNQADIGVRENVAGLAIEAHEFLAYGVMALAALHVLAALKHHLFDRDEVLAHMVPGVRAPNQQEAAPKDPVRLAIIGAGLAVTLIGLATGAFHVFGSGSAAHSPQAQSSFEVVETPATTETPTTTEADRTPPAALGRGQASAWRVDPARSAIGYAFNLDDGAGGNSRIEGRFGRWQADIRFDPDDLASSAVAVTIETGSATNGIAAHDAAMREPGWFDSAAQPTAVFHATDFRRRGDGYEVRGELRIKRRERNVTLPFTLTISGDTALMAGTITLDREDFDLGDGVEGAELVSRNVDVNIRVQATRAP